MIHETQSARKRAKLARARRGPIVRVYLGKAFVMWKGTKETTTAKRDAAFAKILLGRFVN